MNVDRTDWFKHAACRGLDPDMFFPQRGQSADAALRVCATCPVTAQCLAHAITTGEIHGVWGGTQGRSREHLTGGRLHHHNSDPVTAAQRAGQRPIRHGTVGGYIAHRARDEDPCLDCREAWDAYWAARRGPKRGAA